MYIYICIYIYVCIYIYTYICTFTYGQSPLLPRFLHTLTTGNGPNLKRHNDLFTKGRCVYDVYIYKIHKYSECRERERLSTWMISDALGMFHLQAGCL